MVDLNSILEKSSKKALSINSSHKKPNIATEDRPYHSKYDKDLSSELPENNINEPKKGAEKGSIKGAKRGQKGSKKGAKRGQQGVYKGGNWRRF